jgi:hypothetical protein
MSVFNDKEENLFSFRSDTVALSVFRDTCLHRFPIEPSNWVLRSRESAIWRLYIEMSCVCPWVVLFRSLSGQVAPGTWLCLHSEGASKVPCQVWNSGPSAVAVRGLGENAWLQTPVHSSSTSGLARACMLSQTTSIQRKTHDSVFTYFIFRFNLKILRPPHLKANPGMV